MLLAWSSNWRNSRGPNCSRTSGSRMKPPTWKYAEPPAGSVTARCGSAPPLLVRILCGEQRELLGTPNPRLKRLPCAGTPRATGADLEPVDPQRPARPLPSRTPTLPLRLRSTTVPSRHRPPGRSRQRTRSPAHSPSAASSGPEALPPGQPDSASESASTAILRHPHQHPIMGACFVNAHGDLCRWAAGMTCLAAASSRERARVQRRRDRRAGDLPAHRGHPPDRQIAVG
jgi:hypothetical protein